MDDCRSGKVDIPVSHSHRVAELRQPTATPYPISKYGIEERSHKHFSKQEPAERDSFTNCANDDVPGRFHEHDLEKGEHVCSRIVRRTCHEKALASQKTPQPAADKKLVQRRNAAEVSRSGIYRNCPELESISNRVICNEREHVRCKVQHHQMAGVLLSDKAAG